MSRKLVVSLLALGAALGACSTTPQVWTREGATTQLAASDLGTCRQAARQEVLQYGSVGYLGSYWGPRRGWGWGFGWGWGPGPFFATDRSWDEDRLTDFCMRNKGYMLAPAPTLAQG